MPWHKINTKKQNLIIIGGTIILSILILGITNLIVYMN
ncbi:hypothetical protein Desor_3649 [Desulfosporosinus orientis DSM 765]|uniref:Uncharacterized protein n=1 Tax=Desulfosporosinus orientis (strain ATCC 19365 / DSM 765 / NCIMB 8382 / VKM B-1628 / Singapore I) TaxID=768706 RepID=G7WIQ3_DESOD|nr:hypothetical protein Desor_3649 [Desulfosporosinus orientis DSM 765]